MLAFSAKQCFPSQKCWRDSRIVKTSPVNIRFLLIWLPTSSPRVFYTLQRWGSNHTTWLHPSSWAGPLWSRCVTPSAQQPTKLQRWTELRWYRLKAWQTTTSKSSLYVIFYLSFFTLLASYLLHQVGCTDILMLLLRHGAKVTARDIYGVTPLGIAAEFSNSQALDILIMHGKTLNTQQSVILHIESRLIRSSCILPVLH